MIKNLPGDDCIVSERQGTGRGGNLCLRMGVSFVLLSESSRTAVRG